MELFVTNPTLKFEKQAAAQLDEDPAQWSRQVLIELYRELPQITDYSVQVLFSKINREQGSGFGAIIVAADTDTALRALSSGSEPPKAIIPVVVRNYKMMPLDMLLARGGRYFPLTADRLREVLFRPETFDLITDEWADSNLYNMFFPPGRSDTGFGSGAAGGTGGVQMMMGPGMKFSSDDTRYPILTALAETIQAPHLQLLQQTLSADADLLKVGSDNRSFVGALSILADIEASAVKTADDHGRAALMAAPVDVVQISYNRDSSGYWMKIASRGAYAPHAMIVPRGVALKVAGLDGLATIDLGHALTLAEKVAMDPLVDADESSWVTITEPGVYKVKTTEGKELVGWVLPKLVSADGDPLPMAVFTNGAAFAIQSEIAGARSSMRMDLPVATPKAKQTGVFYVPGDALFATEPLVVLGQQEAMDGSTKWLVRTMTGEDTEVCIVDGLKGSARQAGKYVMPSSAKFMPLDTEVATALVSSPAGLSKTSSYFEAEKAQVRKIDAGTYELRLSDSPKLASVTPKQLSYEDCVFTLCLGGYEALTAHELTKHATSVWQDIPIRDIVLAKDLAEDGRAEAEKLSKIASGLRTYLWKEAAALPDSMTVDSVLSLGFINSENIRSLIQHIPQLEQSRSRLGALLLAARVGVSEVPEGAAARALRAVDDVIRGLYALGFRRTTD